MAKWKTIERRMRSAIVYPDTRGTTVGGIYVTDIRHMGEMEQEDRE